MFGYRHAFHAGNYADVLKHAVLTELLVHLNKKDKPYWILDTHAGIGLYPLDSSDANKTKEYLDGIGRVWQLPIASLVNYQQVLNQVAQCYHHQSDALTTFKPQLSHYPGSPLFVAHALRANDQLVACELNPADYATLKYHFRRHPQAAIHLRDGFEAIQALCPPKIKRGMIFIDPSFEDKKDFNHIVSAATFLKTHWHNAMLVIWYPILGQNLHEKMITQLRQLQLPNCLNIALHLASNEIGLGMSGCGMVIVNTPWQFDTWSKQLLSDLSQYLKKTQQPTTHIEWL